MDRKDLIRYYSSRANHYDEIYHRDDPVRQIEQTLISKLILESFPDRNLIEAACGTGYWTYYAAQVAKSILAIDGSKEMLALAQSKIKQDNCQFVLQDVYNLRTVNTLKDAGLAMFWISHVPRSLLREWLDQFHDKLEQGSIVIMADNVYVAEIGGDLITKSDSEDTFKLRELPDGSRHLIVKNYYSEEELYSIFENYGENIELTMGECFWWVRYLTS